MPPIARTITPTGTTIAMIMTFWLELLVELVWFWLLGIGANVTTGGGVVVVVVVVVVSRDVATPENLYSNANVLTLPVAY